LELVDYLKEESQRQNLKEPSELQDMIIDKLVEVYMEGTVKSELNYAPDKELSIFLFVGVNGVGKTTSIGKLAHNLKKEGKKVLIAAGDTFRAGAIDQLDVWAKRSGADIVKSHEGADSAAIIFDAIQSAKAKGYDVLLCDTAGRLQNKDYLMKELEKIVRVIKREVPEGPHEVLLTIDATTGQNGILQAKTFKEVSDVTGVILTKLDGTAKGGIVIAIKKELDIPVKLVGLGENIDDLEVFDPEQYIYGLFYKEKSEEENGKRIIMDSVALSQVADVLDIKLAGIPTTKLGRMPKRYENTVQIGLPMNPNMEVIKSINPTVVYAPDSLKDWLKEGFEKNNIPHKFVDIRSVNGLYSVTEDLANTFGKKEKFAQLKKDYDSFFVEYNKKIENKKKPKVLILMGLPGSYMVASDKSYVGNLVKLAGGENIIKSNDEFSPLNLETALNEQPDIILRTAHAMPDTVNEMFKKEFENNKSWSHFEAVKNNKVVDLDSSIFGMTATFDYQKGLEELAKLFYAN